MFNKEVIFDMISEETKCDRTIINESVSLIEIGFNSINFIKLLVRIEQILDIEIEDEDLDFSKINKVEDLLNVITGKLQ